MHEGGECTMSLKANEFAKCMQQGNKDTMLCLAKVTEIKSGKVFVTFYGEDIQSEKNYKILGNYNPAVGDVVCMARINKSWIVLGKICSQYETSNSKIAASAYGSAESLAIPAKTITAIALDKWDVISDRAFLFSDGGIQCPYDGYVLVTGNVYFKPNGSTEECRRGVYIYKNGTEIQSQYLNFVSNSEGVVGSGITLVQVNAGDVITLCARQSVATTCVPNAKAARLIVAYI